MTSGRRSRSAVLAMLGAVLPTAAPAQTGGGRPDTLAMTCAEAAALVARSGAVVLASGPQVYDRAVRDGGFCTIEQTVRPDYRPTRDGPNCFVGYRCTDYEGKGERGP